MATIRVNPEQLGDAVEKVLKEYFDGIETDSNKLVAEVAAEAVAKLQVTSPKQKHGGKYAKGWRIKQTKKSKANNEVEIYNTQYQLTHLLEHGHIQVVHGTVTGFTGARPHIAQAEQEGINKLIRGIEEIAKK